MTLTHQPLHVLPTPRTHAGARGLQYALAYLLSLGPVLAACWVLCPYEHPEQLLGLYLVEWTFVVAAFYVLAPNLRGRGVVLAAMPFLACFAVAAIVVFEYAGVYDAPWAWSDDWWYLEKAELIARDLQCSSWHLPATCDAYIHNEYGHWSLAGWPYLLGLVGSAALEGGSPLEAYHAVALSLNAVFLSVGLALIFHLFDDVGRRLPWILLGCFLLLAFDPIVYAGMCRKESLLQIGVLATFVGTTSDYRKHPMLYVSLIAAGVLILTTSRPIYLGLPAAVLYFRTAKALRLDLVKTAAAAVVLGLIAFWLVKGLQVREREIGGLFAHGMDGGMEGAPGLGMKIYNLPLVGPYLYYIVSPLPLNPMKFDETPLLWITLLRSVGSLCYMGAFGYVAYRLWLRRGKLFWQRTFCLVATTFLFLFLGAVFAADDTRYKMPGNFFLASMVLLAWLDAKAVRGGRQLQQYLARPPEPRRLPHAPMRGTVGRPTLPRRFADQPGRRPLCK